MTKTDVNKYPLTREAKEIWNESEFAGNGDYWKRLCRKAHDRNRQIDGNQIVDAIAQFREEVADARRPEASLEKSIDPRMAALVNYKSEPAPKPESNVVTTPRKVAPITVKFEEQTPATCEFPVPQDQELEKKSFCPDPMCMDKPSYVVLHDKTKRSVEKFGNCTYHMSMLGELGVKSFYDETTATAKQLAIIRYESNIEIAKELAQLAVAPTESEVKAITASMERANEARKAELAKIEEDRKAAEIAKAKELEEAKLAERDTKLRAAAAKQTKDPEKIEAIIKIAKAENLSAADAKKKLDAQVQSALDAEAKKAKILEEKLAKAKLISEERANDIVKMSDEHDLSVEDAAELLDIKAPVAAKSNGDKHPAEQVVIPVTFEEIAPATN